jgi:hypothetical protein
MHATQTFRKSFVAYIRHVAGTVLWLAAPVAGALATDRPLRSVFILAGIVIFGWRIYGLVWLHTIRWVVRDGGLVVAHGILPWRKSHVEHGYSTIFEAFYQHGFFGHFLNYGTCTIRRTDGVSTGQRESQMKNAKQLVTLINSHRRDHDAPPRPVAAAATVRQLSVDSLTQLAELKASGDLSAEEYDVLKARIVQGSTEAGPQA